MDRFEELLILIIPVIFIVYFLSRKGSGMKFKKPNTTYVEEINSPALWVLCLGPFYFMVKGVWTHAAASAFLAFITCGISWLVYPFFAREIFRKHFLKEGWEEVN